jgi:hypothetical protein
MSTMNERILEYITDIDTRRELGLLPRRIKSWPTIELNKGIVYNTTTCTLYNFRPDGYHEVRRPVTLDIVNDGLVVFNLYELPYVYEAYSDNGAVMVDPIASSCWATEHDVLLKV